VNGQRLAAKRLVIATGARPLLPPIPGLLESDPLTSDNVWSLDTLPPRLAVLGGGPIGCELAQAFARLGSQVTLIEAVPRLLPREDQDVSALIADKFAREGITVRTGCRALRVGKGEIVIDTGHGEASVPFDRLLVALGRAPNSRGFGLEEIGVGFLKNGAIEVDAHLATAVPTISACGDVAGPYQFTHVAAHQAWYAAVNSLFGAFRRFRVDYSVIPWATFCDPEVARVGLNETDATAQGVAFEVTQFDLAELDRAIVDDSAHGFVKVLTVPGRDHILGATIVGAHAGELIAEFTLAMRHGLGLNKLLDTIHLYPSFMEANKYVAGQWRRAHAPTRLLGWVERYLRWQRGGSALPASMARSSPAVAQC
jgi:pyruvate/2-oxoglutarate dehydrogenase complex dihydrolipoamide dehydrogenase (E3) component